MAEATAIVNARPLVPVSTDPEAPCVLSPAVLLTQKTVDSNEDFKNLSVSKVYNIQWKFVAAQLRLSINSVQTKSTGNVHYDITVYYKPRKYLLIYLLVKLTYTNLLIKNNKCYYLQF